MRKRLITDLRNRMVAEINHQNSIRYLKEHDVENYIDHVIQLVYLYTRPKKGAGTNAIFMVEVISAIGHGVRGRLKLSRNSNLAAKTGAFLLYSFEKLGMLEVHKGAGGNGHNAYIITITDDDVIVDLWGKLKSDGIEKLPSEKPFEPWTSHRHVTGLTAIKTASREVLESFTPDNNPICFEVLNRAQTIGWKVNRPVYDIYVWALKNKSDAFAEIWEQRNPAARATKLREAKAIGGIAKKFLNKTFYHLYYFDFRGRKYPTTAYLHEQGSDLARGMLLQADGYELTREGYHWLLICCANNWAGNAGRADGFKTDKIPLKDRIQWALDNEDLLLNYALNPKVNQGWMGADKPWQFLACCIELMNLRIWQAEQNDFDAYGYVSHLDGFIDGSNNGSQHLSALTRDEITAPLVNLVPQTFPGDLYTYVGNSVWERLRNMAKEVPEDMRTKCEKYIDELMELKSDIARTEYQSNERGVLAEMVMQLKKEYEDVIDKSSIFFWLRLGDAKQIRKVVKRNVMTLPYGGTSYGLGQQQIDDAKKHGIDLLYNMEHKWGAFMGRAVYEDCKVSLERPMRLLSVFEAAGKKAEAEGRFLKWTVPITNFPVVQHYVEGVVKKVWIQYGPPKGIRLSTGAYENTYQLNVCFIENTQPSKGKQEQGASPNAIHSLDAAHLAMTVAYADFPVVTIHDSFGAPLAFMPKLFTLVRKTFVELYRNNPLDKLMEDIGGDISGVELGSLDIELVLESEYCFA